MPFAEAHSRPEHQPRGGGLASQRPSCYLIDEQELAEQDLISFAEEQQRVCPSEVGAQQPEKHCGRQLWLALHTSTG